MAKEKKYYTIGDISDICNVPIKTLRYYDQINLLVPNRRDSETNYRYYSEDQMLTLYIIRKLKSFGFNLEEIRTLVYAGDVETLKQKLKFRSTQIEDEIEDLKFVHQEILFTLERMNKGLDFLRCFKDDSNITKIISSVSEGISVEEIPSKNRIFTRRIEKNYQNADVSVARWFEIFSICKKYHLESVGSITLTYHNNPLGQFLDKDCDLEVSLPVNKLLNEPPFKNTPDFLAVTALHVGSHSTIINTHINAIKWVNQNNYTINGNISEEYLIAPIDVKNENEYLTKVIIPINRK